MGRKLNRVPLDFAWPINTTWEGYLNPHYEGHCSNCPDCGGSGESPEAKEMSNRWYGYSPFKPEDRGSKPFLPTDPHIRAYAERQCQRTPSHYGSSEADIVREATRLCGLFNQQWMHHLNDADVAALIEDGRLYEFTHTWKAGEGWTPASPAVVPTAQEVNIWSTSGGMGHDSLNSWIVCKAELARLGLPDTCAKCGGEGAFWDTPENKAVCDNWTPVEPPKGEGYQMWETVSEGSPISPVFATARELAEWLSCNNRGVDVGTTSAQWLKFIEGRGDSVSFIVQNGVMSTGVQAEAAEYHSH